MYCWRRKTISSWICFWKDSRISNKFGFSERIFGNRRFEYFTRKIDNICSTSWNGDDAASRTRTSNYIHKCSNGKEMYNKIEEWGTAGKLIPFVDRVFDLNNYKEAFRVIADRKALGKVVIRLAVAHAKL